MKQRVISGLIGIPLVTVIFIFMYSPIFGIFISLLSAISAFEIMRISNVQSRAVMVIGILVAALVPFYIEYGFFIPLPVLSVVLLLVLFIIMLAKHETVKFEQILLSLFSALIVPLAFSTFILLRDMYQLYPENVDKAFCVFLIVIGLSIAWLTDIFAYFVGVKFGKHKMTPKISPKKTYEGAVGGIVGGLLLNLLILFIFNTYVFDNPFSYLIFIPISLLLSVVSMAGDLSASVIKRNYGAKDFGNLIPGHGGIMDRFDSCLFVLPALYVIVTVYECVIKTF